MAPGIVDGSLLCVAHPMLDLRKGLLDRIEVRRVGWQEPETRPCGFDRLTDRRRLVAAEIVHDDDVARLEDRSQLLLDIGAKALTVDRSVEDARRCQAVIPQRAEECLRAPVAVWRECSKTLALRPPTPDGCHIGLDPGLVDKDKAFRIEMPLQGLPPLSPASNIGAGLLKGEQCFF